MIDSIYFLGLNRLVNSIVVWEPSDWRYALGEEEVCHVIGSICRRFIFLHVNLYKQLL